MSQTKNKNKINIQLHMLYPFYGKIQGTETVLEIDRKVKNLFGK